MFDELNEIVLIIFIAKSRILTLCQGIMLLKTYDGEKKKFVVLESGKLQIFEKDGAGSHVSFGFRHILLL